MALKLHLFSLYRFTKFHWVAKNITKIRGEKVITTLNSIINAAKKIGPKTMAIAAAEDKEVLNAVDRAYNYGIINPILFGNSEEIMDIGRKNKIDVSRFRLTHTRNKMEACEKAVNDVRTGEATMLMKGFVDTSIVLKAVLSRERGLTKDGILSHVGVLQIKGYDKLFILSDSAMNISPNLQEKAEIVRNAVKVAHSLGNKAPKVAILCAVEKVNPKMPATVDAERLVEMNRLGILKDCIVGGPFALDNAVSLEAAKQKGITDPVAGKADILITPNIECGNMLNKSMEYFAFAQKAGIIMGASAPIVLTSRASTVESKLNSIALAVLTAH